MGLPRERKLDLFIARVLMFSPSSSATPNASKGSGSMLSPEYAVKDERVIPEPMHLFTSASVLSRIYLAPLSGPMPGIGVGAGISGTEPPGNGHELLLSCSPPMGATGYKRISSSADEYFIFPKPRSPQRAPQEFLKRR
jgi:hypothetical protein